MKLGLSLEIGFSGARRQRGAAGRRCGRPGARRLGAAPGRDGRGADRSQERCFLLLDERSERAGRDRALERRSRSGFLPGHASLALTAGPAGVALAAVFATILGGRLAQAVERRVSTKRGEGSRLAATFRAISEGVQDALELLREADASLLLGLAGYLVFDVMILWATFHAFGAVPPLAIIWIGYLIGELGGLIPLPGGIGGVDLGLVGALVLYHVPVGAATAAVLGYRALAPLVPDSVLGAVAFVPASSRRRTRGPRRGELRSGRTCGDHRCRRGAAGGVAIALGRRGASPPRGLSCCEPVTRVRSTCWHVYRRKGRGTGRRPDRGSTPATEGT